MSAIDAAALAAWLEGGAPPAGLEWLVHQPELALLRRLCQGARARAAVAAAILVDELQHPRLSTSPPSAPAAPPSAPLEGPAPAAPPSAPLEGLTPATLSPASIDEAHAAVARLVALEEDVARLAPWVGVGWHRLGTALVEVVHDRLAELERLLARAPELAALAARVGRLTAAERRGRHAERGGRESVVGVTTGGELADVLPSELALLADPQTEDLFLMRLAERRLLSLALDADDPGDPRAPERRGPAIVCIDTSGSMIGEAEERAKAATLVVLRKILGQGRRAAVVLFGGEGAQRVASFQPRRADLEALFSFLMTSFHGGTDFDGAIAVALAERERALPGADLVIVSDGRGRLRPATTGRLRAARRDGLRVAVLSIAHPDGRGHDPFGDLADEHLRVGL